MSRGGGLEIHYSLAGDLYYISHPVHRPTFWLGTEKKALPVPESRKTENVLSPGAVEITLRAGGGYWRDMYTFTFFSVKAGEIKRIDIADDLFIDYAVAAGWPAPKSQEFVNEAAEKIEHHRRQLRYAEETAASHKREIEALEKAIRDAEE